MSSPGILIPQPLILSRQILSMQRMSPEMGEYATQIRDAVNSLSASLSSIGNSINAISPGALQSLVQSNPNIATRYPAVYSVTKKNLSGPVSLTAGVTATIDSLALTMPVSGGPWRVWIRYAYFAAAGSGLQGEAYCTDGLSANFAESSNAAATHGSAYVSSDFSTVNYANGENVTFSINAQNAGAQTINTTSAILGLQSYIRAAIISSN